MSLVDVDPFVVTLMPAQDYFQAEGVRIEEKAQKFLGIKTGRVTVAKRLIFQNLWELKQVEHFAREVLSEGGIYQACIGGCDLKARYHAWVVVGKRPGVTDDEGATAQKAFNDFLGNEHAAVEQGVFTQTIYGFENALDEAALKKLACELLGNPMVHDFAYNAKQTQAPLCAELPSEKVGVVSLEISDEALQTLSKERHWVFSLEEMKAIQAHFREGALRSMRDALGMPEGPTDCELEILAQTWSEHCKHKEFNALIRYYDKDTDTHREINSLFKTKIAGSTALIQERLKENGHDWLLKVFSDNAGVVRVAENLLFTWKVETHNTPSALDPYGGAITGVLGCNRDAVGTGVGGARPLFNTNVLCFAEPTYDKPLLQGQLHPARILEGVVEGIMDGGNKMGIPTVNGSIVFDERFCGKPLVFCGTGALMPEYLNDQNTWEKRLDPGDWIIMAGGRVGKDGIHGATLSSVEADAELPLGMVQIGSPATQKFLFDFMEEALRMGLIKTSTDNGAGGLSSSIGELAELTNGAEVHLERVPLKYLGLSPWEVFLSESQERMTIAIEPKNWKALKHLADEFEVEVSHIGAFTDTGYLDIQHKSKRVAYLDLEFLHDGVPQKKLCAEWAKPNVQEPKSIVVSDYNSVLLKLLGAYNICSKEDVIRRYDHEVKGRSVVKPLMGMNGEAPQDAAVIRLSHESYEGLAVSNGILPRYGDIDAYAMSAGAFDEAVRQIIAVGGALPDLLQEDCPFWTVNDNFCVPDSVYDEQGNPDGKYKLAQLVRMCDALYDMALAYNIPMTSGKDSMKNDFRAGDVKISVPPTVLYSMVSKIKDVRKTTTSEFKAPGDLIYLLGETYDELGGSEFYKLFDELGANVPQVRPERAIALYKRMAQAHDKRLITSCHDLSDGGLAVGLCESAFGGGLGASVKWNASGLSPQAVLFSESHSRFLVSVSPKRKEAFERLMEGRFTFLGEVIKEHRLSITVKNEKLIDLELAKLLEAWKGGLVL